MRTIKLNWMMRIISILMVIFASQNLLAQQFNLNNSKSTMSIFGTSSLHDWEEVIEEQSGTIKLSTEEEIAIVNLNVSVVAESIKSEKSAMDKNTYKALKTDTYKNITFKMTQSKNITDLGNSEYQVTVSGKLSISGVTKMVDLGFKMKTTTNTVTLEGETSLNMKDYGIEPPKALFGTITTGEKVTIKFKSILTNQ